VIGDGWTGKVAEMSLPDSPGTGVRFPIKALGVEQLAQWDEKNEF
jgi:hypothetical protein